MKRWGRSVCLVAVGLFIGAGCGGRTDALLGGYDDPDGSGADGSGADGNGAGASQGGATSSGGRPSRAGGPSRAGTSSGGTVSVGGGYPGGAATGGYYGYGGVYAFGGAYVGGAYVGGAGGYGYGGYPVGGTGYGGNPMQPGGACCEARMAASCRPRAVANCVCRTAPYCCDKQWDARCAALVEPLGCGYCEDEPADCQSCLADWCGGQLQQCFSDLGCVSIFSCVQSTGCQAFQCYTDLQCREVIDNWGGPGGYSMGLLLQSFSCAIQSGCPCY